MNRARFWQRYVAYTVDLLIVLTASFPLLWSLARRVIARFDLLQVNFEFRLIRYLDTHGATDPMQLIHFARDPATQAFFLQESKPVINSVLLMLLALVGAMAFYHIACEMTARRATLGKRAIGLRVQAQHGNTLNLFRLCLRFFSGTVSWITLNLGHGMVSWRKDRFSMHDLFSKTEVVSDQADAPLPRWAKLFLAIQLVLFLIPMLYLFFNIARNLMFVFGG
jgi:uncharacterized RDD family membrane protein YckC